MKHFLLAGAVSAVALLGAAAAQATTFYYDLSDHPNGGKSATHDYGLRVDFVSKFFSFDNGAEAFLFYDSDTGDATMYGTMVESTGLDAAGNKTIGNTFDFAYFMTDVTDILDANGTSTGQFRVQNGDSFGFVYGAADSGGDIELGTKSRGSNEYFNFWDQNPKSGTIPNVLFGEGWVGGSMNCCNDFLFTASLLDTPPPNNPPPPAPVPLPAAGWMLLAGLGGMGVMRRRKKNS